MIRQVPYVGLMIDDNPLPTPDVALQMVLDWIAENTELDAWDLFELDVRRYLRRAWWGGDQVGFVGVDHPLAQPVAVVGLFDPMSGGTPTLIAGDLV